MITEDEIYLNPANTISFGQDTATIFYQNQPYYTGDKIKILSYKDCNLSEPIALYLLAVMRRAFSLFSWGSSSFNVNILNNVKICLPINRDCSIDYDYIESRIRELEESRIRELEAYLIAAGFEDCDLSQSERDALRCIADGQKVMRQFSIVKEFTIANSHNILRSDVVFGSGTTPYVTASEGNNSIVSYISYNPDMIEEGNSIMIGGKTLVITYQPNDFFSNDSHNLVLTINHDEGCTESSQLYMVSALYKSLSPKYSWGNSISKAKIQNDEVFLPITADGSIDFNFMETYINAVKKQCIAKLKHEISRERRAYEQAVDFTPTVIKTNKKESKVIILPEYRKGCVPLYTLRAACGMFDGEGLWEEEGWVDASGNGFTPDPKRHFAIYAKGDSMLDKIKDGDICVFEWYNQRGGSREGDIVLAEFKDFDDESAIKVYHSKKVRYEDGSWEHTKIELEPLNKDYPVIELDEYSNYRTIGVFKCVL